MNIEDREKKARKKHRPVHHQLKKKSETETHSNNLIPASASKTIEHLLTVHNAPSSVSSIKRKLKKTSVLPLCTQGFRVQSSDLEAVSEKSVVPKNKKRKRKKINSSETEPSQHTSATSDDKTAVDAVVKKKRRKKRIKQSSVSKMENCANITMTSGNYPKEHLGGEGFSCNWKKLCQQLNVTKPTVGGNGDLRVSKIKTSSKERKQQDDESKEIWFDGVDKDLLEPCIQQGKSRKENGLVKEGSFTGLTKTVAMDCEMVGTGENGAESMVARVSIVNLMGNCVYDKYVKPIETVTNYRTAVSGIRPSDLEKGEDFKMVQQEVSDILDKRILVGHAVHNDLKVLFLTHPKKRIRDTATYRYFRNLNKGNTPSLKGLAQKFLGVKVQEGEHNSVQDAQAAMRLYTMHKVNWEKDIKKKQSKRKNAVDKSKSSKKVTNSPTTKKFSQLKI